MRLDFDATAVTGTHNTGVYFAPADTNALLAGWCYSSAESGGWLFDIRKFDPDITASFVAAPSAGTAPEYIGTPLTMSVVLDPVNGEIWGECDFGDGECAPGSGTKELAGTRFTTFTTTHS